MTHSYHTYHTLLLSASVSLSDITQLITAIGVLIGIIVGALNGRKINNVHAAVSINKSSDPPKVPDEQT